MSSTTGFGAGQRQKGQHDSVYDRCRKQHHRLRLPQRDPGERRRNPNLHQPGGVSGTGRQVAGRPAGGGLEQLAGSATRRAVHRRRVAVARIWKAIQHLKPTGGAHRQPVGSKKGSAKKKAIRKERGTNTKTARITALLKQPAGASLKALMADASYCTHLTGCERFSIGPASFR